MTKCWEYEPGNRPSFQELHKSTSTYIKKMAGYLRMSFYSTKEEESYPTKGKEEVLEDKTMSEPEKLFKCTLHPWKCHTLEMAKRVQNCL